MKICPLLNIKIRVGKRKFLIIIKPIYIIITQSDITHSTTRVTNTTVCYFKKLFCPVNKVGKTVKKNNT
jgi:hypothetical protein